MTYALGIGKYSSRFFIVCMDLFVFLSKDQFCNVEVQVSILTGFLSLLRIEPAHESPLEVFLHADALTLSPLHVNGPAGVDGGSLQV